MHGVISRDEYNFLTKVMNTAMHLHTDLKLLTSIVALVKELISTTQRLLQEVLLDELEDGK